MALGCASGLMVMQLLTPVSQMIEASRAISRSQFDTPDIPLPKQPEIGQLAESFNRMKHSMAQQVNTLQEKNEIERELHRQKTEALELQNRMERSRLQQLRSQIDPHFLILQFFGPGHFLSTIPHSPFLLMLYIISSNLLLNYKFLNSLYKLTIRTGL